MINSWPFFDRNKGNMMEKNPHKPDPQQPMPLVAPLANGRDKPETLLKIDRATTDTLIYKKIQKTWRITYLLRITCRTILLFSCCPRTHCSQSPGDSAIEHSEKEKKKPQNIRQCCIKQLMEFQSFVPNNPIYISTVLRNIFRQHLKLYVLLK